MTGKPRFPAQHAFVSSSTEDIPASSEIVTEETLPIDLPLSNSEDAPSSFGTTDLIHNQPGQIQW